MYKFFIILLDREIGADCVEKVYIHKERTGPVKWGKIVFRNCLTGVLVLEAKQQETLCIFGCWIQFRWFMNNQID